MNSTRSVRSMSLLVVMTAVIILPVKATEISQPLRDPDGNPADMTKKVKVFIIMGQSNTLEMGKVKGDKDRYNAGHAAKYPALKGDVATVYTNPPSMGGASNGHYGGNAKTYMNVGMGKAMVALLQTDSK